MSRSCTRWHGLAVGDDIRPLLLGGGGVGVKPGLEFFTAHGPKGVAAVVEAGLPICLDLKFHDIPNTAAGAIRAAVELSPSMPTGHVSGGPAMLRAAMAASFRQASQNGGRRSLVIGVTVLTSFDGDDVVAVGIRPPLGDQVLRLAELAHASGLDGVVCSAHEIAALREPYRPQLLPAVAALHHARRGGGACRRHAA